MSTIVLPPCGAASKGRSSAGVNEQGGTCVRSASLWLAVVAATIATVALASPAQARGIDRVSVSTILRQADKAMYEAKRAGRNRHAFHAA